jgi:hypothetical protein
MAAVLQQKKIDLAEVERAAGAREPVGAKR